MLVVVVVVERAIVLKRVVANIVLMLVVVVEMVVVVVIVWVLLLLLLLFVWASADTLLLSLERSYVVPSNTHLHRRFLFMLLRLALSWSVSPSVFVNMPPSTQTYHSCIKFYLSILPCH